jgi:hypothetical protein
MTSARVRDQYLEIAVLNPLGISNEPQYYVDRLGRYPASDYFVVWSCGYQRDVKRIGRFGAIEPSIHCDLLGGFDQLFVQRGLDEVSIFLKSADISVLYYQRSSIPVDKFDDYLVWLLEVLHGIDARKFVADDEVGLAFSLGHLSSKRVEGFDRYRNCYGRGYPSAKCSEPSTKAFCRSFGRGTDGIALNQHQKDQRSRGTNETCSDRFQPRSHFPSRQSRHRYSTLALAGSL